jgi:flagellar biosynthesis protein
MSGEKEQTTSLVMKRAVALRYSKGQEQSPTVVAKGQGLVAESIIRKATENGVHVHEDPSLVEVLSKLDLDEQIPGELFQMVAEILTFVYSVDKRAKERVELFGEKRS